MEGLTGYGVRFTNRHMEVWRLGVAVVGNQPIIEIGRTSGGMKMVPSMESRTLDLAHPDSIEVASNMIVQAGLGNL